MSWINNSTDNPDKKPFAKQSRLQSLFLKDGNLRVSVSDDRFPQSLIQANIAAGSGCIADATRLLNDQAIEAVHEVLKTDPSRTDVMFVLAMLLRQTRQFDKAQQWYEKILEQEPNALVYNELGYTFQCMGRISQALEYHRKAVETEPDNAEFWPSLATLLIETGRTQQGISLLRKAVEKLPENAGVGSNLLFCLHHLPHLDPAGLFEEHKRWGRIHAPAGYARTSHTNVPDPDRKLRVGYISPDFRVHPVTYFFEPLLDGHDRRLVEVYGYGSVTEPDDTTERLKSKFDCYRNIRGVDDTAAAAMIEQDKIDVLVELAGHTCGNRLLVLAYKPAPVQVTYLGSPDTTAMEAIDYRLTDILADPPESQKFYTEQLVYLPDGFLCYSPPDFAGPVMSLPALRNGYITFGSFNKISKIHPSIMELWARILKAERNWRLLLKFGVSIDRKLCDYYFSYFEQMGIGQDRIAILGWQPVVEHFRLYDEVDIALDSYPWNGYTITCEALWMGVPVISLVGTCHASRTGLSILSQVGLEFFAASTPDEYVTRAIALAGNLPSLAKLRASMRQRMTDSTLCSAKAFAARVEAAYRKMWHSWCQGAWCRE
jgi:protein O-GlcNAc transferase